MSELVNRGEIDIHIGELIVDGGHGIDRERLATAVAGELGRLVGRHGVRPASATHARIDGGTISPPTGADSEAVGRRVARAVHGALGGKR